MTGTIRRRPTMRDVAEHSGVSVQTVSNLVNNRLRQMSEVTRLRIEEAMAELGYHPNLTARGLRSARTATIGFLLLDEGARYLADPMTDQVIAGVGDVARDRGYSVLIHAGVPGPPDRGLLRPVLESRVDGVLLFLSGPRGRARRADGRPRGGEPRRRHPDVGHGRQPRRRPSPGRPPDRRRPHPDRVHRRPPAVADGRAAPAGLPRGARGCRDRAQPGLRALR